MLLTTIFLTNYCHKLVSENETFENSEKNSSSKSIIIQFLIMMPFFNIHFNNKNKSFTTFLIFMEQMASLLEHEMKKTFLMFFFWEIAIISSRFLLDMIVESSFFQISLSKFYWFNSQNCFFFFYLDCLLLIMYSFVKF